MKHIAILAAVTLFSASAAAACPWAGGSFWGKEMNLRIQFSVNAGCTETVFQSSGSAGFQQADTPETFALSPTNRGWETDIHSVTTILMPDGKNVRFIGPGVNRELRIKKEGE